MDKRILSICDQINSIKEDKNKKGFKDFFTSDAIQYFNRRYLKLFDTLNKIKNPKDSVNWELHIEKLLNLSRNVNKVDIENMLTNIKFRKVVFVYPLGGQLFNEIVEVNESIKIVPYRKLLQFPNYLYGYDKTDFEHLLSENISVVCITALSEEKNDFFKSEELKEQVFRLIKIMNFNSQYVWVGTNLNKYRLLSPSDMNSVTIGEKVCPFKIIDGKVVKNTVCFYDGRFDFELATLSKSSKINIDNVKNMFNVLQESTSKNKIILRIISLINDSLLERNKEIAFLKLIMALDSLLERSHKYDKRPIRNQLSWNIEFILNKHNEHREIRKNINKAYSIRSEIVHEGKEIPSNANKYYKFIFFKLREVIEHLLYDERFKNIHTMSDIFMLIDKNNQNKFS